MQHAERERRPCNPAAWPGEHVVRCVVVNCESDLVQSTNAREGTSALTDNMACKKRLQDGYTCSLYATDITDCMGDERV
ncbi:hypothetical protein L1887_56804 [Cichorium endivia]|nr:hypothetical protein L1887_56804 [Cichorium endivia]